MTWKEDWSDTEPPYEPLKPREYVSNEKLRERFLELEASGEITAMDVAYRAGYVSPQGKGDSSFVRRLLGISAVSDTYAIKNGKKYLYKPRIRHEIHYERAVQLCRALNIAPHELGL